MFQINNVFTIVDVCARVIDFLFELVPFPQVEDVDEPYLSESYDSFADVLCKKCNTDIRESSAGQISVFFLKFAKHPENFILD